MIVNLANIKAEMARKNLKINDLAEHLNLSYQGFYQKINGERNFKADEIFKISQLLNVDVNIFFNQ